MIESVTIGDSTEDVIYLLTVSDVATGHTFLLVFCFVLTIVRLLCMKFSN